MKKVCEYKDENLTLYHHKPTLTYSCKIKDKVCCFSKSQIVIQTS